MIYAPLDREVKKQILYRLIEEFLETHSIRLYEASRDNFMMCDDVQLYMFRVLWEQYYSSTNILNIICTPLNREVYQLALLKWRENFFNLFHYFEFNELLLEFHLKLWAEYQMFCLRWSMYSPQ
jgi:hypothetical protein